MPYEHSSSKIFDESSPLTASISPSFGRRLPARRRRYFHRPQLLDMALSYCVAFAVACLVVFYEYQPLLQQHGGLGGIGRRIQQRYYYSFPNDFVWGCATSAHQIEGGSDERGLSIWDTFSEVKGAIIDGSSAEVACDHYHRIEEDVLLMKNMGLKAYRFSISWPRLLPDGTGEVNQRGVDFYNKLIDGLVDADIEPYVTLYHWDLPQALQDRYEGWLSHNIIEDFANYARLCFESFGDRVKNWITINEAWTVAVNGYNNGVHAPGHWRHSDTEPYRVAHHLLLAHAQAVHVYRRDFQAEQGGVIGISIAGDYRYPADPDRRSDLEAAERAMVFQVGWFADPIWLGDYPREMKDRLGERLPTLSRSQRRLVFGSSDFFGLNHYSSLLAARPEAWPHYKGYWADINVDFSVKDVWQVTDMGWPIVPDGCKEMLIWISERYDYPDIYMTESGSAVHEPSIALALFDSARRSYFERYLAASAEAIEAGANLRAYFAWSLFDNYEYVSIFCCPFFVARHLILIFLSLADPLSGGNLVTSVALGFTTWILKRLSAHLSRQLCGTVKQCWPTGEIFDGEES
jgi:beta-glucosidase/6-phospho-beta-glucosidase/beta-galactosidase